MIKKYNIPRNNNKLHVFRLGVVGSNTVSVCNDEYKRKMA